MLALDEDGRKGWVKKCAAAMGVTKEGEVDPPANWDGWPTLNRGSYESARESGRSGTASAVHSALLMDLE
jgi:hypothetical protein